MSTIVLTATPAHLSASLCSSGARGTTLGCLFAQFTLHSCAEELSLVFPFTVLCVDQAPEDINTTNRLFKMHSELGRRWLHLAIHDMVLVLQQTVIRRAARP